MCLYGYGSYPNGKSHSNSEHHSKWYPNREWLLFACVNARSHAGLLLYNIRVYWTNRVKVSVQRTLWHFSFWIHNTNTCVHRNEAHWAIHTCTNIQWLWPNMYSSTRSDSCLLFSLLFYSVIQQTFCKQWWMANTYIFSLRGLYIWKKVNTNRNHSDYTFLAAADWQSRMRTIWNWTTSQ